MPKINNIYYAFNPEERNGIAFEDSIVEDIISLTKRKDGSFFGADLYKVRKSTPHEDKTLGTDLFLGDIPIDITLHGDGKNNTRYILNKRGTHFRMTLGKVMRSDMPLETEVGTVRIGIRTGNSHHKFNIPVLVLAFDLNINLHDGHDMDIKIKRSIRKHLDGFLKNGTIVYHKYANAL